MENAISFRFVAYNNGVIRNAKNELVAIYNEQHGILMINGFVENFRAESLEHAFDIINANVK